MGKSDTEGKINLEKNPDKLSDGHWVSWCQGAEISQKGHIWLIFAVPRHPYGLEVIMLRKKDTKNLKRFQQQSLKQIQAHPNKTPIILALLGILPTEAVLHINISNLFVNMTENERSVKN